MYLYGPCPSHFAGFIAKMLAQASFQHADWTSCFVEGHGFSRAEKETPRLRRPYGTPDILAAADPTLKRGANLHCAYGAGAHWNTGAGFTGTHFIHRGSEMPVPDCYKTLPVRPCTAEPELA
jgi:hypothetical protein